GRTRILWTATDTTLGGERYFPFVSPAATPGECAATLEGFFTPQTVAMFRGGAMKTVREMGPPAAAAGLAALGRAEAYRWTAQDGWEIHGWLLRPAGDKGPRAVVTDVHGGPVWACRARS